MGCLGLCISVIRFHLLCEAVGEAIKGMQDEVVGDLGMLGAIGIERGKERRCERF